MATSGRTPRASVKKVDYSPQPFPIDLRKQRIPAAKRARKESVSKEGDVTNAGSGVSAPKSRKRARTISVMSTQRNSAGQLGVNDPSKPQAVDSAQAPSQPGAPRVTRFEDPHAKTQDSVLSAVDSPSIDPQQSFPFQTSLPYRNVVKFAAQNRIPLPSTAARRSSSEQMPPPPTPQRGAVMRFSQESDTRIQGPPRLMEAKPYLPKGECCPGHDQMVSLSMNIRFGSCYSEPREVTLDTGCEASTIQRAFLSAVLPNISIRKLTPHAIELANATKEGNHLVTEYADIPIFIDGTDMNGAVTLRTTLRVLVDSKAQFDLLLGNNFMVPQGAHLDLLGGNMYLRANGYFECPLVIKPPLKLER
ncbi:uncharacterized protein KY384_005659 [Bacidia gigantensis]|uniref:uncharacterized protein n=1 Tax=Bacidia gigantensis TaxID=2732470 RepID=UPI001D04FB92|nr:uncharacterized protein KY384_005659 [Bacidia gigantensis]KAG8530176.1 hypothetical protein KY384_005659 [Bacidia gigantensis]